MAPINAGCAPLTEKQRHIFANAFTLYAPENFGLTQEQFDFLKEELAGEPPEVVGKQISSYKHYNEVQERIENQKAEEASLGINSDNMARLKENTKLRIDISYEKDDPFKGKSILGKCPYRKVGKRAGIKFSEPNITEPKQQYYVPQNKTRQLTEEFTPKRKPVREKKSHTKGPRIPVKMQNPKRHSSIDSYRPKPSDVLKTPTGKKFVPQNITSHRGKLSVSQCPETDETEDKAFAYAHFSNMRISRNTPLSVLRSIPPGSIVEIIE